MPKSCIRMAKRERGEEQFNFLKLIMWIKSVGRLQSLLFVIARILYPRKISLREGTRGR